MFDLYNLLSVKRLNYRIGSQWNAWLKNWLSVKYMIYRIGGSKKNAWFIEMALSEGLDLQNALSLKCLTRF